MLHVREFGFLKLIYLLLPCLKYCICPAFFISITLHFPLMYIDTRTYWNVFLKHLHDSVLWFIFIYPFALFVLFASGKGYLLVCWYWFIISIFICLGFLVKNFGSGAQTKVCGLELKPVQPSEIRDSLLFWSRRLLFCIYWTGVSL